MKIITVLGARPQFIKSSVVSRAFKLAGLNELIVHTGQHFDKNMSDVFFEQLDIPKPNYNLGIGGGTHGQNTGRMIEKVEEILFKEQPDWLLVYGDTDTTLAAAVAAAKLHIPLAHIEAGLRSFNKKMPEEVNRVLTDHAADILFAPTDTAVNNLSKEGVSSSKILKVGDVMYDATVKFTELAEKNSSVLSEHQLRAKTYILCTIHRAENTNERSRLINIFEALGALENRVVLPLHPRTRNKVEELDIPVSENILILEPQGYLDMLVLEKNASVIATDSGGVQKEAFFHKVPCVTLRDETEWTELVDSGWNKLVSTHSSEEIISTLLDSFDSKGSDIEPYGDGSTAERVAEFFLGHEKIRNE